MNSQSGSVMVVIPSDSSLPASPQDHSLVRCSDDSKVYWLQNGKLYWVTDWSVINDMSSLPGWSTVNVFPSDVFNPDNYPKGPRFITTGSESNGLLIQKSGEATFYFIKDGKRNPFSTWEAFTQRKYDPADVIVVTDAILNRFGIGAWINQEPFTIDLFLNKATFATGETKQTKVTQTSGRFYTVKTYYQVTKPDGTMRYAYYSNPNFQPPDPLSFSDTKRPLYEGTWISELKTWHFDTYTFTGSEPEGQWSWELWYENVNNPGVKIASDTVAYTFGKSCEHELTADLNCDGEVDSIDSGILMSYWGTDGSGATSCRSPDINQDGIVDSLDLSILMSQWTRQNKPPVARVTMKSGSKTAYENQVLELSVPSGGTAKVDFSASRSSDPDGSISSYKWYIGGSLVNESQDFHHDLREGTHDIFLTVTDNKGAKGSVGATVKVIATSTTLNVPFFSQCNPAWSGDKLGHNPKCSNIRSAGCALTSAAMVMAYYGVDTDPKRLNDLIGNKGYISCDLNWSVVANKCHTKQNQIKFVARITSRDLNRLDQELSQGYPVILDVGGHFVVARGKIGNAYYIHDPLDSLPNLEKTISSDKIKGLRIYRGTPSSTPIPTPTPAPTPSLEPGILDQSVYPNIASAGDELTFVFKVNSPSSERIENVRFGARIRQSEPQGSWIDDPSNDKVVTLEPGAHDYSRKFMIPSWVTEGFYDAQWVILEHSTGEWIDAKEMWRIIQIEENKPPTARIIMTSGSETAYEDEVLELTVPSGGTATVHFSASRSSDPDGTISSYQWLINGQPAGNKCDFDTDDLSEGTYDIFLTVTDNEGAEDSVGASIIITATVENEPPTAGITMTSGSATAYENQVLELTVPSGGTARVYFYAGRSYDPDGSISSYKWYISGSYVSNSRDFHHDLGEGTHQIYLTVKDNQGAEGSVGASVKITANKPPVARITMKSGSKTAYENQILELTVPSGGTARVYFYADRSYDPDGSISSYKWYIGGSCVSDFRDFHHDLGEGTHQIYLTVKDNQGAEGSVGASVKITATNNPPIARITMKSGSKTAYENQVLELTVPSGGTAKVYFYADRSSDPDGSISSYKWYIGGSCVSVSRDFHHDLGEGTHQIYLTVKDNKNAENSVGATVKITANKPPVARITMKSGSKTAYENQVLELTVPAGGTARVYFYADRSSDPDGSISSYKWYIGGTFVSSSRDFSYNLGEGTCDIFLTVTDNKGAEGSVGATVKITATNNPPTARITMKSGSKTAYENQVLELTVPSGGTAKVDFSASRSSDPEGSISSYKWYIGGTFVSSSRDFSYNLGEGTHDIFLTVKDNNDATGSVGATVKITR